MPIYEFKCMDCEEFVEFLLKSADEEVEMVCSKCKSENLERVISATNYSMGAGSTPSSSGQGASSTTRKCSGGSCTTYDIPGPA